MGSLRGHHAQDFYDAYEEIDDIHPQFERKRKTRRSCARPSLGNGQRRLRHGQPSESFKCHHCRAFIGAPMTGGRHRNHCPNCLWSLHVDLKTPGDRASRCRSLMEPVGVVERRNGEQAVVHRCRGCGIDRHCRVAADDNPLLLMKLRPVVPDIAVPAVARESGVA